MRDLAQEKYNNRIDHKIAAEGLARLGVDEHGLSVLDRRILETILIQGGGPVGLKTLAISVGEEEQTIEEVYEPHLIRMGLLKRTHRGRCSTIACDDLFGQSGARQLF